jgi:hypothetical protein
MMGSLMQADPELNLPAAYEQASWAHPETKPLKLAEQRQNEEAKRQAEAKERTEKAQRAKRANLGDRPSHNVPGDKPVGSIDDTMRGTLEDIQSRG